MDKITCWYCGSHIHRLDDTHTIWCRGNWKNYRENSITNEA